MAKPPPTDDDGEPADAPPPGATAPADTPHKLLLRLFALNALAESQGTTIGEIIAVAGKQLLGVNLPLAGD